MDVYVCVCMCDCFHLLQVSIVPRTKGILGFAQHLPSDQKLHTTEQVWQYTHVCTCTCACMFAYACMFTCACTCVEDVRERCEIGRVCVTMATGCVAAV